MFSERPDQTYNRVVPRRKTEPKDIEISDEVNAKCDAPDQFNRFDRLVGAILTVPHSEIVRREKKHKRSTALDPNRRGPKKNGASRDLRA
jgi:hypothetical protein